MEDLSTEEHIKRLYERIAEQGDRLKELNETIRQMIIAFTGDKDYGSRGYRHRIEKNEENIDDHEKRMNKMDERFKTIYQRVMGIAVGVTIAALAIGWMIVNIRTPEVQANPIDRIGRIPDAPPLSEDIPVMRLDSAKFAPKDRDSQ